MIDALKAILASNLRLSSCELAAIGGFYDRFVHDLLNGKWPVPRDIYDHFLDNQEDLNGITNAIGGWYRRRCSLTICIWGNAELRAPFSRPPGRGSAQCGFIEPYRIAGLAAINALKDRSININILFFDPKRQKSVQQKNLCKNFEKALYFMVKNPKSGGISCILNGKNMPNISLFIEEIIPPIF